MIDGELSSKITERKIKEIMATGAAAVVTSCQQCVRTMTTWVRRNEAPLQVMDIAKFVSKALDA
jgi:heterodisulfide reductase subunit D